MGAVGAVVGAVAGAVQGRPLGSIIVSRIIYSGSSIGVGLVQH